MQVLTADDRGLQKLVALKTKILAAQLGDQTAARAIVAVAWVPTEVGSHHATSAARVACLTRDGDVEVWDTATGARVHRVVECGAEGVLLACWRGRFVVVARSGGVRVFPQDAASGAGGGVDCFEFSVGGTVSAAALHPETGTLAAGGRDNDVALWDLAAGGARTWVAQNPPPGPLGIWKAIWVTGVAFLREGTEFAGAAGAGAGAAPPPGAPAFSPHLLAVASGHRTLRLYDTRSGRLPAASAEDCGEYPFTTLAVSACGGSLVTGDTAGNLRRWGVPSLQPAGVFKGHSGAIKAVAVHPTAPYVATASLDRTCLVFHADTRQLLRRLYLKQRLSAVLFAPGGAGARGGVGEAEGAMPGAGRGVRKRALVKMHTARGVVTAEEAGGEGGEGEKEEEEEGGAASGEDEDDVWEELQRRAAAAAEGAAGRVAKKRR
jgi:WD40 repeat protein